MLSAHPTPAVGDAPAHPRPADPFALSDEGLASLLAGQPSYRIGQVRRWLARGVADPTAMTDLPKALRERLAEVFPPVPRIVRHVTADRGLTHKVLLELGDGEAIESVLLCYPAAGGDRRVRASASEPAGGDVKKRPRATVCISTQAGCAMGCPFCATGQAGLRRQLRVHEVIAQIAVMERLLRDGAVGDDRVPDHVTNVVFMGMGEPLANLNVTTATLGWLTDADRFGLSARNVTVSTIGLVPAIRRLRRLNLPITLAVSLHAPNDALRDRLVPINRRHPLAELLAACDEYAATTRRRLTFEYVLIDGVNAGEEHARELADLLSPRRAHVNLIPMNPTPAVPWVAPAVESQRTFAAILEAAGLTATIRHNRGTDIDAACGQLYANYQVASGRRVSVSEPVGGDLPTLPATGRSGS
ncbi:MAG TPA: 23S rRNA (adenine(2503)-C(2))-methyltransferase RlmN [Euzebyales bacterium]|nr:23S rRNA (adenine(2503)-C(2))-methyltransferase RlmN [Euzebyales bacterium]